MNFESTTFLAPSGAFASAGGYSEGCTIDGNFDVIYNPGIIENYRTSYEIKPLFGFESDEWLENLSKYQCKVQDSDFDAYGERITYLTTLVDDFQPDCSLGPLRGAAKPCVLVEVMNKGSVQYDFFDFQRGSDPQNHGRIISDLKEILEARDPERENFRINVTDTAHGGQGINALVSALKEIKDGTNAFKKQIWNLDVHLLHTDEANLSNIRKVLSLQDFGSFQINLGLHPVPNLIFEDYDPALAVEMKGSHGRFLFKPCARPGKMLFRKNDEVFIIETDNTSLMLEEFLAESITANLLTSLTRVPAQDVWADYQNKA